MPSRSKSSVVRAGSLAELRQLYLALERLLGVASHRFRPKKFKASQLAVLLFVKRRPELLLETCESLSYAQVIQLLTGNAELQAALDMRRTPHRSTLAHAECDGLCGLGLRLLEGGMGTSDISD